MKIKVTLIVFSLLFIAISTSFPANKRDQTNAEKCVNVYDECPVWKSEGMCEQNPQYMEQTCPVTCDLCKGNDNAASRDTSQNAQQQQQQPPQPQQQQDTTTVEHIYPGTPDQQQSVPAKQPAEQAPNPVTQNSVPDKETNQQNTKTKNKEDETKELKPAESSDERDSQLDEEEATNEQTQPSSKHIEKESLKNNNEENGTNKKKPVKKIHHENARTKELESSGSGKHSNRKDDIDGSAESSGSEGSGQFLETDVTNLIENGFVKSLISRNVNKKVSDEQNDVESNELKNSSSEDDVAEDDVTENEEVSGEVDEAEEGSANSNRAEVASGKDQVGGKKAEMKEAEKEENTEEYEDEEPGEKESEKPAQQRSDGKQENLMEKMINNGDLQAIAVSKPKTRTKVPADDSEAANEGGEGEDESTDVDLDFKETGLDQLSGSGDDENLHLTLKQTYNKKYDDKESPAFKILTGNFEKDMMAALGEGNEVSDINFSETEVEGNPKTTGKVRVNFKFSGNYDKLAEVIKSGNINGLLVVKNSLEGPMLDVKGDGQ